jgi:hypothetical protein
MLEAIADFWRPAKKLPPKSKVNLVDLQVGSAIGFGFMPQVTLSGRRLTVTAINTYKFGDDVLTSFVLSQDKDAGASMIVAETDGEQYLALSRRISMTDRNKLFDTGELDRMLDDEHISTFSSKEGVADYKGWTVANYKREIKGTKGLLYRGDYRKMPLANAPEPLEFAYTLLVSEGNEHALEIERYEDGRVEVYATVYRRIADIGEITPPAASREVRPDLKLESAAADIRPVNNVKAPLAPKLPVHEVIPVAQPKKPEPKIETPLEIIKAKVQVEAPPHLQKPKSEIVRDIKLEVVKIPEPIKAMQPKIISDVKYEVVSEPIHLKEFSAASIAHKEEAPAKAATIISPTSTPAANAAVAIKTTAQPYMTQEIKAVNHDAINQFVNESIDCELQVANKIIDEAIRNEMRINDVVRRVIGLPVSQQESVQIPVTLTDQDYALLAIRYGIAATDRDAIKRRITEDLGDFSGSSSSGKKKAA